MTSPKLLQYERILSFRPRMNGVEQPPLRDMVFDYYSKTMDAEKANLATIQYLDMIYRVEVV